MKDLKALIMTLILVLVLTVAPAWAHGRSGYAPLPSNYVNVSFAVWHPAGFGIQHRLATSVFLTGQLEYLKGDNDLLLQGGAAYMIPRKFWVFRLYGGGGLEFTRNESQVHPYASVGTKFWIFYTDVSHPLRSHADARYRFGFSFSF
ncbi:MAG: hypothetical protein OEW18_03090 [Candidatus Aminicenantes bacterium]|nr:hypothetical protein [Candidatus Aminicenantes bacterium]